MSDQGMPTTFDGVKTSPNLTLSLNRALEHARDLRQREVTIEHLLLALTDDPDATGSLEACGVDIARLKTDIATYVDKSSAGASDGPAPEPVAAPAGRARARPASPSGKASRERSAERFGFGFMSGPLGMRVRRVAGARGG